MKDFLTKPGGTGTKTTSRFGLVFNAVLHIGRENSLLLIWTRVLYPYVNLRIWETSIKVLFFPDTVQRVPFHPWCLRPAPSPALIISLLRGSQSNPVYQFQSQPLARNTIRSLFSALNLIGPEFTWLKSLTTAWQENHGKQETDDHQRHQRGKCTLTSDDWSDRILIMDVKACVPPVILNLTD